MQSTTGKIPLPEKIAYGFGDMASCLYWKTFMAYLMFFYTDIFGISPGAVGTMLLVARIWDGINDPMMGAIADRTNTRWGKFRPYLIWILGPFVLFGVLTFTTPELSTTGKLIWAYCTYIPLMMFYTAINIPYTAMLGVMSPNPDDRTVLSSVKFIFAFGGNFLIAIFLLPLTRALGGVDRWIADNFAEVEAWKAANPGSLVDNHPDVLSRLQDGWSYSFMVVGVFVVIFFLITFFFTRERVKPPADQKTDIWQDLNDLVTNKPWWILLAATISFILFTAIRTTVSVHYFKYFVATSRSRCPSSVKAAARL
jgi:GPH family glycoside/pentoside/hexuronide:cation symporter